MRLHQSLSAANYLLLSCATFVLFLGLWLTLSHVIPQAAIFLPAPTEVARQTAHLFRTNDFLLDIGASVWRVTAGFLLSVIVALPIGLLAGTSRTTDALIQPFNDFLRYLPVAAFIPLTILWAGIGDLQKILVIFLGTVFQLIPLVADTTSRVPRHFIELAYTMGAPRKDVLLRVVLPWCAPVIYDHCRIALGWAWSYLVVAELVAADSGVGHLIIQSQRFIQTANVMAGILIIGLLGVLFDQAFKRPKRTIFPWL